MDSEFIIFFDGVCNLCNRFVDWIVKHDRKKVFKIASLQGKTAQQLLGKQKENPLLWSVILYENGQQYQKSEAIFKIIDQLGGIWKVLKIFSWLPLKLRDRIYDSIAHRRYRWFGQKSSCRLPKAEEQERFLP